MKSDSCLKQSATPRSELIYRLTYEGGGSRTDLHAGYFSFTHLTIPRSWKTPVRAGRAAAARGPPTHLFNEASSAYISPSSLTFSQPQLCRTRRAPSTDQRCSLID